MPELPEVETVVRSIAPKIIGKRIDKNMIGFSSQNDFVEEAVNGLKDQCKGGKLTGILTKHQTTAYVLVFKREIIASGYCSKA